jgi:hypothetical protein
MSDNLKINYTSNQSQIRLSDIDDNDFENLLEKCKSIKIEMDNVYHEKVMKTYEELFNYEFNKDSKKKNEEKNDEANASEEEKTNKEIYYNDSMDMEESIRKDIKINYK